MSVHTTRRTFVQGLSGGTAALNLKCAPAHASDEATPAYRAFEDLYRNKWTCDPVAHGIEDGDLIRIFNPLAFAPNQTYKDFTCDCEKADPNTGFEAA